ncbi:MAG: DUF2809 domain-containing protein [Chitinophagaceae bacterium]|nr:DUF2809 domain-containing protein [Chitinophagaceae bacterium]
MSSIVRFNLPYFLFTVMLFVVEVLIAIFTHDPIIRPYVGDVLVMMLIYCFVRSFLNTPVLATALCALFFSYVIETLQYFHIVNKLGLKDSSLARTVIGTSFAWTDLLAYTIGIAIVLYAEKKKSIHTPFTENR